MSDWQIVAFALALGCSVSGVIVWVLWRFYL